MEFYQFVMLWSFSGILAVMIGYRLDSKMGFTPRNSDIVLGCFGGAIAGAIAVVFFLIYLVSDWFEDWWDSPVTPLWKKGNYDNS